MYSETWHKPLLDMFVLFPIDTSRVGFNDSHYLHSNCWILTNSARKLWENILINDVSGHTAAPCCAVVYNMLVSETFRILDINCGSMVYVKHFLIRTLIFSYSN